MGASNGFGKLVEERFLDFRELSWVHDFEDIFDLVQKHDFLRAVDFRPVAE